MSKNKINPELKSGDRVSLILMSDETSLSLGDVGTVISKQKVFGVTQYGIKWDNGSSLSLLSDADYWMLEDEFKEKNNKSLNENDPHKEAIESRGDSFKMFNMKFFMDYLITIRDSGIVNMFGASDLLWLGKDRIEHEFKYKNIPDEEKFDELLEMSDTSQMYMVNGVVTLLQKEGKELTDRNINNYLKRYSSQILQNYIYILS